MENSTKTGREKNLKVRDHLGELGVDGRIILQWILKRFGVRVWNGFNLLRAGLMTDYFEHGN
jgi:hypothetical protein